MFGEVNTGVITSMYGTIVTIEADVSNGLPCFDMVGDLNLQAKEARERVRTAIKNSGYVLLAKKVVINAYPADVRKEGSTMDLAIAIAVLTAFGFLPQSDLGDIMFLGELSLQGRLNPVNGVMAMVAAAKKAGIKKCIVPMDNLEEGCIIQGVEVYGASCLKDVCEHILGEKSLSLGECRTEEIFIKGINTFTEDFADINGQPVLKRVCEIAATGLHNLLMIGPPGSGKTMAARRLAGILPSFSMDEAIEISSIYSMNGNLSNEAPLMTSRPFREVHHTATKVGMIGGARKAGEVTLSHKGILFLDEFPEFDRSVLECLRQPMESGRVQITRANAKLEYPAEFMLVAAMNPCKCGYYPDLNKCRCSAGEIRKYLNKISGPMLDRIDLCTETSKIEVSDILDRTRGESSKEIRARVEKAHEIQRKRYSAEKYKFNSKIPSSDINKYCQLDKETVDYLRSAFERLELSARIFNKVLKVSRTIADLEGCERILLPHVKEALMYRGLDRKYLDV